MCFKERTAKLKKIKFKKVQGKQVGDEIQQFVGFKN